VTVVLARTAATPAPGVAKMRVTEDIWSRWTQHEQDIRTCGHCHTVYRNAGAANVCEHYHEGGF
jgi:hypothetical protein